MSKSMSWWTRKLHRWGALIMALPLIVVIVSGLLLQVKKQVYWIQPPTNRGTTTQPSLPWPDVLAATQAVPQADVVDWSNIDRLDVRPSKGLIKVRCQNGWELQLDAATGKLLGSAYRRSDLIESIHDGSFFLIRQSFGYFCRMELYCLDCGLRVATFGTFP